MFCNLKIRENIKTRPSDILEYYNNIFVVEIDHLLSHIREKEVQEEFNRFKRRKLSVPDNISHYHFENESAFSKSTILYEPLKKTIFNEAGLTPFANRLNNKFISNSAVVSPMIRTTSMSATGLSRTPRTNRVLNCYLEVDNGMTPQSNSINPFQKRVLDMLSSSKVPKSSLSNCF
jgi:hypothetical protein